VLQAFGNLTLFRGDFVGAEVLFKQELTLAQELPDRDSWWRCSVG
jgi:hypothetical protein